MESRPYQKEAIASLWRYWKEKPRGVPLLVCPTGSGKSHIIASIINIISKQNPTFRFLIATHTKEIVDQNSKELQALLPSEPIGIYSAGLGQKRIRRVTFANVQSIYKKAKSLQFDMLIVDEAHLISQNDTSMYQKLIDGLRSHGNNVCMCGLTATPFRMDQGNLTGGTFTDIAYDISVRSLIDDGYLSPLVSIAKDSVDITQVRTSGADYNQIDLQGAFNKDSLIDLHCKNILELSKGRSSILVFCSGVEHAKNICAKFREREQTCDYVTGEMINWERDKKIREFKDGTVRILCNVGMLTTGFNYPALSAIALLRSTRSTSLYIQILGRGMRKFPSKNNCLVLDYGGNIDRHGPIDCISVGTKNSGDKADISVAPTKKCPICGCVVHIKESECENCGYIYPENTKHLTIKASAAPLISEVEEFLVTNRYIKRHKKFDKPDSVRIEYVCGIRVFMEFLCFDHGGYAASKAKTTWVLRKGQVPIPASVNEAMTRYSELPMVDAVRVVKNGKYYEILAVRTVEKKIEEELLF